MIVLDASAAIEFLLGTAQGHSVKERIAAPGESVHAPELLDVEVAHALRGLVRRKSISAARGEGALGDLRDLVMTRYPHGPLLARIWSLRDRATAYDASYLALAETLAAPLLTRDRRMAGISGIETTVEVI